MLNVENVKTTGHRDTRQEGGFTVVELLISTAVFSMVLLLCATAIVQIGRMFYKGVTINRIQDTARLVIDDISQSVQFGENTTPFYESTSSGTTQIKCFGRIRYSYNTTGAMGNAGNTHILWKDRLGANQLCGTAPPLLTNTVPSVGGQELLGTSMRFPVFNVSQIGNIYLITIRVAYGETNDLFVDNTYSQCIRQDSGGQFCAISDFTTSVLKRL